LNEPDGQHIDRYEPELAGQLIAEAADLVRAFGFAAHHVVLIGGLVPGLLVPVLDPGIEPHVGTADIDLCLSLALVQGDTESYERMETVLKRLGFAQGETSFRWHRQADVKLTVEFFCPAGEDRPAGRAFRPTMASSPTAKHNMGGHLSALALNAGELLTADAEIIQRTVELPKGKGVVDVQLRGTGPLAFLVAKVEALNDRDKPKDAYDIVWLIESWPGGPADAAAAFAQRPTFASEEVQVALRAIRRAFEAPNSIGSRSYARFVATTADDEARLERNAVAAIAEFLANLPAQQ
jgi:hypothetical protein